MGQKTWSLGLGQWGVAEGIHTLFTLKLRRSVEFLTNSDFLARVELSLSLRFNWKQVQKKGNHWIISDYYVRGSLQVNVYTYISLFCQLRGIKEMTPQ